LVCLVHQDPKVPAEVWENLDQKDPEEIQERLVSEENVVKLVFPVQWDQKDLKDPRELQVSREHLVNVAPKELMVSRARKEQKDKEVNPDSLESLEHQDLTVQTVVLDPRVNKVSKVKEETLEPMVKSVNVDHLGLKVSKDQLVTQDFLEPLVNREALEQLANPVIMALSAHPERMVSQEHKVSKDQRDELVPQETVVQREKEELTGDLEMMDPKESWENLEVLEELAHVVSKDQGGLLV